MSQFDSHLREAVEGRAIDVSIGHYGMERQPVVLLRIISPTNTVTPDRVCLTAEQAMDFAADLVAAAKGLRPLEDQR